MQNVSLTFHSSRGIVKKLKNIFQRPPCLCEHGFSVNRIAGERFRSTIETRKWPPLPRSSRGGADGIARRAIRFARFLRNRRGQILTPVLHLPGAEQQR